LPVPILKSKGKYPVVKKTILNRVGKTGLTEV
jgi:hypothetical protein